MNLFNVPIEEIRKQVEIIEESKKPSLSFQNVSPQEYDGYLEGYVNSLYYAEPLNPEYIDSIEEYVEVSEQRAYISIFCFYFTKMMSEIKTKKDPLLFDRDFAIGKMKYVEENVALFSNMQLIAKK